MGGIGVQELNGLEVEMLNLLHFDLYVHQEHYANYLAELQRSTLPLITNPLPLEPLEACPQYDDKEPMMRSTSTLGSNSEVSD